ncbi:hypothetical protein GCM10027589_54810 [Actinocorallia lasiicapitis]
MTSHRLGEITIFQCDFCRGVFVSEPGLFQLIDGTRHEPHQHPANPQPQGAARGPYAGRHRQNTTDIPRNNPPMPR